MNKGLVEGKKRRDGTVRLAPVKKIKSSSKVL